MGYFPTLIDVRSTAECNWFTELCVLHSLVVAVFSILHFIWHDYWLNYVSLRAQWVCSRQRRIVLYKQSSINYSYPNIILILSHYYQILHLFMDFPVGNWDIFWRRKQYYNLASVCNLSLHNTIFHSAAVDSKFKHPPSCVKGSKAYDTNTAPCGWSSLVWTHEHTLPPHSNASSSS